MILMNYTYFQKEIFQKEIQLRLAFQLSFIITLVEILTIS